MDIFGIGGPELLVIMVVMLLVLGPERMVDFARQAGKMWREAQLAVRSMADAATAKLDEEPSNSSPPREPVDEPKDAVTRGGVDEEQQGSPAPGSDVNTPPADETEASDGNGESRAGQIEASAGNGEAPADQAEAPAEKSDASRAG